MDINLGSVNRGILPDAGVPASSTETITEFGHVDRNNNREADRNELVSIGYSGEGGSFTVQSTAQELLSAHSDNRFRLSSPQERLRLLTDPVRGGGLRASADLSRYVNQQQRIWENRERGSEERTASRPVSTNPVR